MGLVPQGIGPSDNGCYYVESMYRDVGFRLTAEWLSREEVAAVLRPLLQ